MFRQTAGAALEKALEGTAARGRAIAGNIANAETPGYQPRRVAFEEALQAAVAHETGGQEAPTVHTIEDVAPRVRSDPMAGQWGVTVNLETEMTDLARNNIQHEALVRALTKSFRMLRSAITGGSQG